MVTGVRVFSHEHSRTPEPRLPPSPHRKNAARLCIATGQSFRAFRAEMEFCSRIAQLFDGFRPRNTATRPLQLLRRGDARRQDFTRRHVCRLGNWAITRSPQARKRCMATAGVGLLLSHERRASLSGRAAVRFQPTGESTSIGRTRHTGGTQHAPGTIDDPRANSQRTG